MLERNHNIVHKDGGLYNIGMKRLISVEQYSDTFVIPEGVEYIAECAFWKCERLKHVVIPNSVVDIGTSAFAGCESLIEIIIPDSVERIGANAFGGCSSLTKVILPALLKFMGGSAFYGCNSLKQVVYRGTNFMVDEILSNVENANVQLGWGISANSFYMPLVIDVIFRLYWKDKYNGFFRLSSDYEVELST